MAPTQQGTGNASLHAFARFLEPQWMELSAEKVACDISSPHNGSIDFMEDCLVPNSISSSLPYTELAEGIRVLSE